jgi:FtsP/CotA-like multicopper oxidase with cupredoxin domain
MDSLGVPAGRSFTYFYRLREPGTYMYHCHFEDTEHVHMGMTGTVFIRPAQNAGNPGLGIPAGKYVYNDGVLPGDPRSTAYDREFVLLLTEIWAHMHWNGAHIQETDWSDYEPDFFLLNGRTYPNTLAPNGGETDPVTGDLIPPPGYPELQYQPLTSLIQANAGDRVLLRIINLGFKLQTMTLAGLDLHVVGKDATLLRGRDGSDLSYRTNSIPIGPGESVDAIFTAPNVGAQTNYLFYNRNYNHLSNAGGAGYGGQMTEARIFPAGTLPPQTRPNT